MRYSWGPARVRNERGIALVVTILGMLLLGALVAGVFMSAVLEHRAGLNSRPAEQAFAAAEYGLAETIASWNVAVRNALPALGGDSVFGATPGGSATYAGQVRRLNSELFLVDITGRSSRGAARQRIGAIAKLRSLNFDIQAVLTSRGATRISGNADLDATDHLPPGWPDCPATELPKAGIRLPNAGDLTFVGGCSGGSCIIGDPKVEADPTINDSTFFDYGDADWAGLKTLANKVLPEGNYQNIWPGLAGDGSCDQSRPKNWGDPVNPTAPCGTYYPITYVQGDLTVNTGVGQGLLLVEGDLRVQGNFQFYGIVIVRGRLEQSAGTGNKITGAVLAANVALDDQSITGSVDINYSSCAVLRAQQAGALPGPLRSRHWAQLF